MAAALRITNFRLPAYVPISIAGAGSGHPLDLAKPILFDCDYDYEPAEDQRLTVRWFRDKEPEPFYQWIPERESRTFADWIKPLINETFVIDPMDPLKRYRSLLIRRLSMELSGQYTCLVSSLSSQDSRQGSVVVFQPPRGLEFTHTIYPAPAGLQPPPSQLPLAQRPLPRPPLQQPDELGAGFRSAGASPTQFKGLAGGSTLIRPPNNNLQLPTIGAGAAPAGHQAAKQEGADGARVVYTHDGRPIRKKQPAKRQATDLSLSGISAWTLRRRLEAQGLAGEGPGSSGVESPAAGERRFSIQLHHFQCHASRVSPMPVIVLSVKRNADSIAQYLHESSSRSVRPTRLPHDELYGPRQEAGLQVGGWPANASQPMVTLYDITVSATVALNVTLDGPGAAGPPAGELPSAGLAQATTVLSFRRGQRMSFECQLEITDTEFERRERITINEEGK